MHGRCEICEAVGYVVRDHDHGHGNIRGLLCDLCNTRLGLYEKEQRGYRRRIHNRSYRVWRDYYLQKIEEHLKKDTGIKYQQVGRLHPVERKREERSLKRIHKKAERRRRRAETERQRAQSDAWERQKAEARTLLREITDVWR